MESINDPETTDQEILSKLSTQLNSLSTTKILSNKEFFNFLITHFKPPVGNLEISSIQVQEGTNEKKLCKELVRIYHPDKQSFQPRWWKLLSQEITKEINQRAEKITQGKD